MKKRLMPLFDKLLLSKRAITESVIEQLKNIFQIELTRHHSPINAFVNIIVGSIAIATSPRGPSLGIIPSSLSFLLA